MVLVRHCKQGSYDFWVAPGGGIIYQEDIYTAAVREVMEETGLSVNPIKPVYLEQFYQPGLQHIKTWVLCEYIAGEISVAACEAVREHIVEAQFMNESQVVELTRPLFPDLLKKQFWSDLRQGFPEFKYLGNRAMEFY